MLGELILSDFDDERVEDSRTWGDLSEAIMEFFSEGAALRGTGRDLFPPQVFFGGAGLYARPPSKR